MFVSTWAATAASRIPSRALVALLLLLPLLLVPASPPLRAQPAPAETLHVYGPGGPLPAMKEAAAEFGRMHGIHVAVVGGPTPQWLAQAKNDAGVIFSGSEHMMTDFVMQLKDTANPAAPGSIDETTITPLYLRPAAILVRPGNPKRVRGFEDLLRPGIKVLVVQGAGQTGLWEDIAGRTGDISVVRALRRNIAAFASNSADARQRWTEDRSLDAWIIWNIWQKANPTLADVVPLAPRWRIYRDGGVALTRRGSTDRHAREFRAYLQSPAGAAIFAKWGWIAGAAPAIQPVIRASPGPLDYSTV